MDARDIKTDRLKLEGNNGFQDQLMKHKGKENRGCKEARKTFHLTFNQNVM